MVQSQIQKGDLHAIIVVGEGLEEVTRGHRKVDSLRNVGGRDVGHVDQPERVLALEHVRRLKHEREDGVLLFAGPAKGEVEQREQRKL